MFNTLIRQMKPVIVILGATGTGKSKLAIELACKFKGEIISADSMQVYKDLDIVTNKVTQEERLICPHHMIDVVSPLTFNFKVTDFRNTSLQIMEDIWSRNKLPFIVGGTNYYIESLLWDFLLDTEVLHHSSDSDEAEDAAESTDNGPKHCAESVAEQCAYTENDLYGRLKALDPRSAEQIHPNDTRKIQRALQIYQQTGLTRSQHLQKQHENVAVSGRLRFPETKMIWIQCEQLVLDERINTRVDDMIKAGLVSEMLTFHQQYKEQHRQNQDYTTGIFQTIGFKEFHEYLTLADAERQSERGRQLFNAGVDEMKRATRKYARRQLKWMMNRFLKRVEAMKDSIETVIPSEIGFGSACCFSSTGIVVLHGCRKGSDVPEIFAVDGTVVGEWETKVFQPAAEIVSSLLEGRSSTYRPLECESGDNVAMYRECTLCNVVTVSSANWQGHITSRRHKKKVDSMRKLQRLKDMQTADVRQSRNCNCRQDVDSRPQDVASTDLGNQTVADHRPETAAVAAFSDESTTSATAENSRQTPL